jgi:hypothetical protein
LYEIRRLSKFLEKSYTEEQLTELVRFTSFKEMKYRNLDFAKSFVGSIDENTEFIRVGKFGEWRKYFTSEMAEKVDNHVAKNLKSNIIFD